MHFIDKQFRKLKNIKKVFRQVVFTWKKLLPTEKLLRRTLIF